MKFNINQRQKGTSLRAIIVLASCNKKLPLLFVVDIKLSSHTIKKFQVVNKIASTGLVRSQEYQRYYNCIAVLTSASVHKWEIIYFYIIL